MNFNRRRITFTIFLFGIRNVLCVHVSSGKGEISEGNLERVEGARSPVECVLKCQQRKKNAFYGDDGSCGCFEGTGDTNGTTSFVNGFK